MAQVDTREIGKKGGEARATKLTPSQRSEIARKAAVSRWSKDNSDLPKALCGGKQPLRIGEAEIPCYVLEEGFGSRDEDRRVITASGLQRSLGMSASGGSPRLASFAASIADNPSMGNDLSSRLKSPVEFALPGGGVGKGYSALILSDLCDAILEARKQSRLADRLSHVADAAETLVRGFAVVGIVALVDEATDYQEVRRRLALADILDSYLDDNLNKWTKTFPDDFYQEFFRLKGWDYQNVRAGDVKPAEVGTFTRDEVYRRLHPGIVDELERSNPYVVPGRRMYKHHQWLTREVGHATLERHVAQIVVVMKLSNDWLDFESKLQRVLPKASDTGFLDFIESA